MFEAAIRVKSMYMINHIHRKSEKEKIWKSKLFYIYLHLKYCFVMEFTACQCEMMTQSADIITVCDAFRYFAGLA